MTRPVVIQGAGLFISADVAADLGPVLMQYLEWARRDCREMNPDTVETVEKIDLLGNWWRSKSVANVAANVATFGEGDCEEVEFLTVKATSDILNISHQAVTGLLARGSLHGELVGRTWRVSAASVKSRKAGSPCPN